ncbi:MAG: DUF3540 domain-containing protein [Desulfovibrio sp.]|nr:DUF3540 domain-containing protein [Desulfovibrio sp.]
MGFAEKVFAAEGSLNEARVQHVEGDMVLTVGPAGLVKAVRAAGCLLLPEPGDTVLLALTGSGRAWVVSVLVREHAQASLRLPDASSLSCRELSVQTEKTSLNAETLSLSGSELSMAAGHVTISSRLLSLGGRVLLQGFAFVRTLAGTLSEHLLRRNSRIGSLSEHVEQLSERHSGRVRETIDTSYRLRAENADVRAKEQIDLDARHIKLG